MNKKIILTMALMLFLAPLSFAMSYDEAKSQNKPIVLFFHMERCSGCKSFEPIFNQLASKYSNKFNFVHEDVYKSKLSLASQISSVPSVFIVDPKSEASTKIDNNCLYNQTCIEGKLNQYK